MTCAVASLGKARNLNFSTTAFVQFQVSNVETKDFLLLSLPASIVYVSQEAHRRCNVFVDYEQKSDLVGGVRTI